MSDAFPTPRVVISRCIEFDHCRWNGMIISSDVVKLLKPHVDLITVCPEVAIGLGVPRDPVRIIDVDGERHLYQPATDTDHTEAMQSFAQTFLDGLTAIDGFILKTRSPSCGMKEVRVYPPEGKMAISNKGVGLFGAAVLERFGRLPIEDEGRLTNFAIREHFLTHLYATARFREAKAEPTMGNLVQFHSENKLVLMGYNQEMMRSMGRLVANHEQRDAEDVWAEYEVALHDALGAPPSPGANINVLMHALGYFSDDLSAAERAFFLQNLEDYRAARVPLSVPISIMRAWIVRFGEPYLAQQTFFRPYPEDLVAITDSGKGRDF